MAIDAEDILVCLWRFLGFFINTSYVCVQKYPFLSGTFLLFFLVYVFFNLLVYHSPFLICIAILLRFFWSSERHPTIQDVEEKERRNQKTTEEDRVVVVNRNNSSAESSVFQRQKSRRTIVKERNREWIPQPGEAENDLFSLTIDKKNLKLVIKGKESSSFEHGESTSDNVSKPFDEEKSTKSDGGGRVLEADNVEEADDDDDDDDDEEEEEGHEDGNKAMEWTEDDQKNLMDLGLLEIERNRRLESLIAKRRARKNGLAQSNSVPQSQIAPVFVARSNPFEVSNGANEVEGSQVPGSAPSILLPAQNPFDLPYDPLEEKPDLMADSFHQEFTAVNQKEMLYCRHESFTLGPFQFEPDHQDRRDPKFNFYTSEKRAVEGFRYPRFKRQSGDHDKLIEQLLTELGVSNKSHIDHTPPLVKDGSRVLLNSEVIQPLVEASNDESCTLRAEGSNNLEPTTLENVDQDNELTISLPIVIQPLYDSSPTANDKARMDQNNLFLGDKMASIHTPTFSIASDLQVEVSEGGSPSLTVGNVSPIDGDSLSYEETNFDNNSYADINKAVEQVEKLRDSRSLETEQLETLDPQKETVKEANVVDSASDSVADTIDDREDHRKYEDGDVGSQILIKQEILETLPKLAETKLESNKNNNSNSQNLVEHQSVDPAGPLEGNADLNLGEKNEKQTEQESITNMSKSIDTENKSNELEDRKEEQSLVESEVSSLNQNSQDTIVSAVLQETTVDEFHFNSSSSTSPTSTLVENIPVDEVSSSNLDKKSHAIDAVKTSPFGDTSLVMSQNGEHLEDSTSHLLSTGNFELIKEPYASEKFSNEGNNIITNRSEPMIDEKATKEEPETLLNPKVAADLSETPAEIGFRSNEDIENVSEKLAEEPINTPNKAPEEANYEINDPAGSEEKKEKENLKSVEEGKGEKLFASTDTEKYHLQVTESLGSESSDLIEHDPETDQSSTVNSTISISTSTAVGG